MKNQIANHEILAGDHRTLRQMWDDCPMGQAIESPAYHAFLNVLNKTSLVLRNFGRLYPEVWGMTPLQAAEFVEKTISQWLRRDPNFIKDLEAYQRENGILR